jgi:predicted enzyme related to lactoylglutathione lyase
VRVAPVEVGVRSGVQRQARARGLRAVTGVEASAIWASCFRGDLIKSLKLKEKIMENTIVWADIPVTDLDRAMKFYGAVLQRKFQQVEGMAGIALEAPPDPPPAMDAAQGFAVSFDLALVEGHSPSTDGCTVYLNSGGEPEAMIQRAVEAGGKLLAPVADMGQMVGSIGFFLDSEGNRIGVHKPPQM